MKASKALPAARLVPSAEHGEAGAPDAASPKVAKSVAGALAGAVAAAGVVYYLDGNRGSHRGYSGRRVGAPGRLAAGLRLVGEALGHCAGTLTGRARGAWHPDPAETLAERVRLSLSRVVSYPQAVNVSVEETRRIVLRGAVLAWEHGSLLRAVQSVAGVAAVCDELVVHESAEHVDASQGAGARGAQQVEGSPQPWTPGARLLTAAGGALLLGGLLSASLRKRARRAGRPLELRRSMHVRVALPRVFATLRDCECFPSFMRHLREVRLRPEGGARWVATGPSGIPLEWDAVMTQVEAGRLLAWRTLENSSVQHWGMLRLEGDEAGTRLQLYLNYQLPPGRAGRALASFLGGAPASGLIDELARLQRHLEALPMPMSAPAVSPQGRTLPGPTARAAAGPRRNID